MTDDTPYVCRGCDCGDGPCSRPSSSGPPHFTATDILNKAREVENAPPESMRELVVMLRAMGEDEAVTLLDTVAAGLVEQGVMLATNTLMSRPVQTRTAHPTKRSRS